MHMHKWLAKHLTHNHSNFAQKLNMQLQMYSENEVHKESNGFCEEENFNSFLSKNSVKSFFSQEREKGIEQNQK